MNPQRLNPQRLNPLRTNPQRLNTQQQLVILVGDSGSATSRFPNESPIVNCASMLHTTYNTKKKGSQEFLGQCRQIKIKMMGLFFFLPQPLHRSDRHVPSRFITAGYSQASQLTPSFMKGVLHL